MSKQVVEFAVCAGRYYQSGQTNYIHYCYNVVDQGTHDTIPLVENFLFALALLRIHSTETVNEAKKLLDGLLHFQGEEGNFPIYLHHYPRCKSRTLGIYLIAPFYWILKDYGQIIGNDLRERLTAAAKSLVAYAAAAHEEKPTNYPVAMNIAAGAFSFGKMLSDSDLTKKGKAWLNELCALGPCHSWYSPEAIGHMLVALQMAYPTLSGSPWKSFWEHLGHTWHRESLAYVGPALEEKQLKYEPQPCLYDFFMGTFTDHFSYRAAEIHPYQLYGALIQPTNDAFPTHLYPHSQEGSIGDRNWQMIQTADWAFCVTQKLEEDQAPFVTNFYPLRLLWGDRTRTHTFVNQGGNCKTVDFTATQNSIDLSCELLPTGNDRTQDLTFFLDNHENLKKNVEGKGATTFQLGEEVQLRSDGMSIDLAMEEENKGSSQFMGHFSQGNRPSQMGLLGKHRFTAFDWQLFVRTVRGEESPKLKVSIRLNKEV